MILAWFDKQITRFVSFIGQCSWWIEIWTNRNNCPGKILVESFSFRLWWLVYMLKWVLQWPESISNIELKPKKKSFQKVWFTVFMDIIDHCSVVISTNSCGGGRHISVIDCCYCCWRCCCCGYRGVVLHFMCRNS